MKQMQYASIMIAGLIIAGLLPGCGTSIHGSKTPSNTNVEMITQTAPITIFNNPDYVEQSRGTDYIYWYGGNVGYESASQMKKMDEGGHSPWQTGALLVAVYGTEGFLPPNQYAKQTSSMKDVNTWKGKYKGATIIYHVVSTTKETNINPATATVKETGLSHDLMIYLYKPLRQYRWLIYKVVLEN